MALSDKVRTRPRRPRRPPPVIRDSSSRPRTTAETLAKKRGEEIRKQTADARHKAPKPKGRR